MAKDTHPLSAEELQSAFIAYYLENDKEPASVFHFMKTLHQKESVFYTYYPNFLGLQRSIWKHFISETLTQLEGQEAYANYSGREKILGFYFTLAEVLKENKSYVDKSVKHFPHLNSQPPILEDARKLFMEYIAKILAESIDSKEIEARPILSERYADILWLQFLFLLKYWTEDSSAGFEKTDAAIEKAVNLAFDLMGKSVVDSALDFAKFLFEKKN